MSDKPPEMSESFPEDDRMGDSASALTAQERASLASKYDRIEEVGRGAMGIVYRARHKLLNRPVAIKTCLTGSHAERLHREAQLLARLHSPHIVTIHDFDRSGQGRALLIMDWVEGRDLGKILKDTNGPSAEARVLPWMRQVCQGMQAAAAEGIIHRDLKPSNILIDEQDCAHVSDFGLARSIHDERLTLTGDIMGTPYYMAPEQAEDPHRVDTRADIYSFGATYYHVLTGQPPFKGETPFAILFKHKTEPLISPRARNPRLSSHVSDCLERCLAKSPQERFSTFADLLTSLAVTAMSSSPWDAADEPDFMPYLRRYHQRRRAYIESPSELIKPDVYSFPQQRELRIAFGSLTDQKVDALVSSVDGALSMGGGVAAALLRAAGGGLYKEAQLYSPVRPGRAVVTSAWKLPARFVFHGVTMGFSNLQDKVWVEPSRDLITEIMESCFYHADTLGVSTMAFPLLGTGVGGFVRDVCLDTMFRFLVRKLVHGVTSVRQARIILWNSVSSSHGPTTSR